MIRLNNSISTVDMSVPKYKLNSIIGCLILLISIIIYAYFEIFSLYNYVGVGPGFLLFFFQISLGINIFLYILLCYSKAVQKKPLNYYALTAMFLALTAFVIARPAGDATANVHVLLYFISIVTMVVLGLVAKVKFDR